MNPVNSPISYQVADTGTPSSSPTDFATMFFDGSSEEITSTPAKAASKQANTKVKQAKTKKRPAPSSDSIDPIPNKKSNIVIKKEDKPSSSIGVPLVAGEGSRTDNQGQVTKKTAAPAKASKISTNTEINDKGEQNNKEHASPRQNDAQPAKRARSGPQLNSKHPSRRGPKFQGVPLDPKVPAAAEPVNFGTTIFEVHVTGVEEIFYVHEFALIKSRKLVDEIEKVRSKARRTQHQIIHLGAHDGTAFRQMVQFLYGTPVTLNAANNKDQDGRLNEFHQLFSIAQCYELSPLQKEVVSLIKKTRIMTKVPARAYIMWAEDMYFADLDRKTGEFTQLFRQLAPGIIRGATNKDIEVINEELFATHGGPYAQEVFSACYKAIFCNGPKAPMKKEPGVTPVKPAPAKKTQAPTPAAAVETKPPKATDPKGTKIASEETSSEDEGDAVAAPGLEFFMNNHKAD